MSTHSDDPTGDDPIRIHWLAYVAAGWVVAGVIAWIATWPRDVAATVADRAPSLLLLLIGLLGATMSAVGAAIVTEARRR